MAFIIIYVTFPSGEEASKMTIDLLDKKLVACGNIFPIKSAYWWEGKIKSDDEVVAIFKTKKDNWEKVKAFIKKSHSYKVPCIMKMEASANKEYEDWINKSSK